MFHAYALHITSCAPNLRISSASCRTAPASAGASPLERQSEFGVVIDEGVAAGKAALLVSAVGGDRRRGGSRESVPSATNLARLTTLANRRLL